MSRRNIQSSDLPGSVVSGSSNSVYVATYIPAGFNYSNDASSYITAAIAACQTGGEVIFPAVTLSISHMIVLPSFITIRGLQGVQSQTPHLKVISGSNLSAVLGSSTFAGNTTVSDKSIVIRDLYVNANSAAQYGIAFCTWRGRVFDCHVTNTLSDGITWRSATANSTVVTSGALVECGAWRTIIESAGGHGFSTQEFTGRTGAVTDGFLVDCTVNVSTVHGAYFNQSGGWKISGNHTYGQGNSGIYLIRGGYTRITDNYVESYGQTASTGTVFGIYVQTYQPGTVVANNNSRVDPLYTGNTWVGIYIQAEAAGAIATCVGNCVSVGTGSTAESETTTGVQYNAGSNTLVVAEAGNILDPYLITARVVGSSVTVVGASTGGAAELTPTIVESSGTYAAAVGDEVLVDLSTSNVTITLPSAPADQSQVGWKIIKYTLGYVLTINSSGSDVFEIVGGATTQSGVELFQAKVYQYQNSTKLWIAVAGDRSLTQTDLRYVKGADLLVGGSPVSDTNPLSISTTAVTPAAIGAVATSSVGAVSGVASLDSSGYVPAAQLNRAVLPSQIGVANGVASLDSTGNVPVSQLGNAPTSGGGSSVTPELWQSNLWYPSPGTGGATSLALGHMYFRRFYTGKAMSIKALALDVTVAASSGGYVYLGVYSASNGLPGTQLGISGQIVTTATGAAAWTPGSSIAIAAGATVFLAALFQTALPTTRTVSGTDPLLTQFTTSGTSGASGASGAGLYDSTANTASAPPATANSSLINSNYIPDFRVQAA